MKTKNLSSRIATILVSIFLFTAQSKTNAQEGAYWMGLSSKNPAAIGTPSNWVLGNFTTANNDFLDKNYNAYSLFADFEINPKAGVIGANFLKEELEYQKSFMAQLLYAYNLSIKEKGKLSIGANLGMFAYEDDLTEYSLYNNYDPLYSPGSNPKAKYLKSSLGTFYHTRKLDLGISYNLYSELDSDFSGSLMDNTFTVLAAYRFIIKDKFTIEPNILLDFSDDNDGYLGLYFEYDDLIWAGYNSKDIDEIQTFIAGIDIARRFRLAYSFSFTEKFFDERTKIHEFVLGFKIK